MKAPANEQLFQSCSYSKLRCYFAIQSMVMGLYIIHQQDSYTSSSSMLLMCQANGMVGLFFVSLSQERMLCFVVQRFVLVGVEMGVHPALIGAGRGESGVRFALGVKSGEVCGRCCSRGDSCHRLAAVSVKLYRLHIAACPSPQAAAPHWEQSCGLQVTF